MPDSIDIPLPFTAIARNGLSLLLSHGKRYDMSTEFANQLTVDGVPILSGPIQFWAQRVGGSLQQITAAPTVTAEEPGLITLAWEFDGNGFSASGTTKIYCEGRIQFDFRLTPDVSTYWEKVYWIVPFAAGIAEFMTKQPRYNGTEHNGKTIPWNYQDPGQTYPGWNASFNFPRAVFVHNETHGFAWAQDSDANYAPSTGDADGTRRATMSVTASEFRIDIIRKSTASFASATINPLTYRMHIMACPPKTLSASEQLSRFGEESSTPALTQYRPLTEETGTYRWHGAGVFIDPSLKATQRTARLARGLGDMIDLIYNNWATAEPTWNSAWQAPYVSGWINNPALGGYPQFPQYSTDQAGVEYYSLISAKLTAEYQTNYLTRLDQVLPLTDAIYIDVTDYKVESLGIDAFGRGAYLANVTDNCNFVRRIATKVHAEGKKLLSHAQSDLCPMRDCFFDWVLPGEQWNDDLSALSNNAYRRFHADGITENQWRAEMCPQALGTHIVMLPQWAEASNTTTDEWFMTEVMAARCVKHQLGIWYTNIARAPIRRLFAAQKQYIAGRSLAYQSPWSATLATTADSNARVATYASGNVLVAIVINEADTDRTVAITLSRAAVSATIRYAGTGQSPAEGRASPGYTAGISGSGTSYSIGVGRKNMTMVEFELTAPPVPRLPPKLVGLLNWIKKLKSTQGSPARLKGN
jgi:hypothetical protein